MDAPDPPDPKETAAAQAAMNKETAITQYGLAATNQVTPYGNLTYEQTGTWEDGTPRYQATQTLSPEMQQLFNKYSGIASNLGDIGTTLSNNVKDNYGQPFQLDNEATESRLFELGSKRLDPRFAEGEDQLRTRLHNQGLMPGTPAWEAEMRSFGEGKNDAYNQLLLTGRKQAGDELLTERNQGLNEMLALLSGTQVQQPNYASTPSPGVSGVDYAGLVNQNYQAEAAQHQAKMDGLFSLAGTVAGGWARGGFPMPSDRRVKWDIAKVGQLDNGLNVYGFKYIGSKVPQIGLMADEVREIRPDAVVNIGGVDHVRYDLAVL
jgi:hypothetical protein